MPIRVRQIRKKEKIRVLFELYSLGAWKTESLYRTMLAHSRFEPILVLINTFDENAISQLENYAKSRGYQYQIGIKDGGAYWKQYRPDIIFYQKQYSPKFYLNKRSLFCYVPYSFHAMAEWWAYDNPFMKNLWQNYFENLNVSKEYAPIVNADHKSCYGTGLPCMDDLLQAPYSLPDPWKKDSGNINKKRIIYAPHHSVSPYSQVPKSTFLDMGEMIFDIAKKYSDRVQWVFKPHPLLSYKMEKFWSKEKIASYYRKWEDVEWAEVETGEYIGLFKHSDAMIHDCSSFMVEYIYTMNPVMYLVRNKEALITLRQKSNSFNRMALDLHQLGHNREEIEAFIEGVINGDFGSKESIEKRHFIEEELTPPNSKLSSQNIIECILGESSIKPF